MAKEEEQIFKEVYMVLFFGYSFGVFLHKIHMHKSYYFSKKKKADIV